jgi:hypothetical protein
MNTRTVVIGDCCCLAIDGSMVIYFDWLIFGELALSLIYEYISAGHGCDGTKDTPNLSPCIGARIFFHQQHGNGKALLLLNACSASHNHQILALESSVSTISTHAMLPFDAWSQETLQRTSSDKIAPVGKHTGTGLFVMICFVSKAWNNKVIL